MGKYYRNVKTGQVITEEQYQEYLLENAKASSWDMANAGMDLMDEINVQREPDEYEEYTPEEDQEK